MQKSLTEHQKTPLYFTAPIVILSIILFFCIIIFINLLRDEGSIYKPNKTGDNLFYYYAENNNFYSLYQQGREQQFLYPKDAERVDDAIAIGDYYHASLVYTALKDENPTLAQKYHDKMEDASNRAGDLSFKLADVDALFEAYQSQ